MPQILWTIGHSTRLIEEFLRLLEAHGITLLVDVRTIPYSRRNPHFNRETFAAGLKNAGLAYNHLPVLGGRRRPRPDSPNQGWRNAGFRGYADYMQTDVFKQGVEELDRLAQAHPTAIMCAEAVPWRCHRSLIADALIGRGLDIRHIITTAKAEQHQLTSFAKLDNGTLVYPAVQGNLFSAGSA
ncbi:MAG: DNA repair protein [Nitrospiraceae bacterium]